MQSLVEQSKKITDFIKSLFKNKVFYLYLALFLIILASSFNSFFIILTIFIIVYAVIFLNFENSLSMLLFLFPFKLLTARIFDYLFAFAMLVYWVKFIIKTIKTKEFKKIYTVYFIAVAVFIIYLALPIHKSFEGEFKSSFTFDSFLFCFNLFSILFLFSVNRKDIKFLNIFRIFVISFILSNLIGVICIYTLNGVISIFYRSGLLRFSGTFSHPNRLALAALFIVSCLFYLYLFKKIKTIEFLIYFTPTLVSGYLTLSRNFLYGFYIALFIFLIANIIIYKKYFYKQMLVVLFPLIIVGFCAYSYSKVYINELGILDLFFGYGNSVEKDYEDLLNGGDPGRGGLIKVYFLDLFSSALVALFGRGIAHGAILEVNLSSHNTYLEMVWKIGIVGLIIFLIIMFLVLKLYTETSLKILIKKVFSNISFYVLLITPLIGIFIENIFYTIDYVIYFILILFVIHEGIDYNTQIEIAKTKFNNDIELNGTKKDLLNNL